MRKALRIIGLLGLLWAVPFAIILAVDLTRPETPALPAPAAAIICLGGGMSHVTWERPDPASTRRARSCAELYRAGVAPVVLFTGYGHQRGSAAAAMARIAMEDGVPEAAVILEEEAKSTLQNAVYALALLPAGTERLVIVTDAFHIPRSWLIFRAFGAPEATFYPARDIYTSWDRPGTLSRREWLLRESVAIWVNLARAGIYLGAGLFGIDAETRIGWFN
ncbi:MAG: YdcF family protein [Pseudomonadota bacterium]